MGLVNFLVIYIFFFFYQASGYCYDEGGTAQQTVDQMQDFMRSRLNAYRSIYDSTHIPLTPTPRGIYCDISYAKTEAISSETDKPIETCPDEAKYQWDRIDGAPCCPSTTDCNDLFLNYWWGFQPPSHNFTLVIGKYFDDINDDNVEEAADSLLLEPNADAIFDFQSDQACVDYGDNYAAFTAGVTERQLTCHPYTGAALESSVPPTTSTTSTPPTTSTTSTSSTTSTTPTPPTSTISTASTTSTTLPTVTISTISSTASTASTVSTASTASTTSMAGFETTSNAYSSFLVSSYILVMVLITMIV